MAMVDLRSDTVTRPSPGMRRAIAEAEVGDDVFGDDPTVQALEARVAEILGKEAALFVPSGTMGNQIGVALHTRPGDEVLLEATSHVVLYEGGGPAVISGVQLKPLPGRHGLVEAETLRAALRPKNVHYPPSTLLVMENTHNRAGGRVLPLEGMEATAAAAREAALAIHLDGARIWNASVASGIPERRYAALADSVSVCVSKGLGAPVGSILAASAPLVDRARHIRKRLGGGMRQAGILAAAGLYAIEHNRARLADDHRRARVLAERLREFPELSVDLDQVETNIVIAGVRAGTPEGWCAALAEEGVRIVPFGPGALRIVTHLDAGDEEMRTAAAAFEKVARRAREGTLPLPA
ncbi:MAG: low specificity L-threonine aldolase [Candidatus Eisenbacteria bacterium]